MRKLAMMMLLLAPAAYADDKPKKKEVVLAGQYTGDADAFVDTGNKLKRKLEGAGEEVLMVRIGTRKDSDISDLAKLKDYIKSQKGFDVCLSSFHFLGHGIVGGNNGTALRFPPTKSPGPFVHVDDDAASTPADPAAPVQFGKANFAALLDSLLCPDGEIFIDACNAARPAAGGAIFTQRLADETGRVVHGYQGVVLFPGAGPPQPATDGEKPTDARPNTPAAGYNGSGPLDGGKGRRYCWDVTPTLKDPICDVHIAIPAGTDASKFGGFGANEGAGKPLKGWSGKVTKSGADQDLSFYVDDCKNARTAPFQICVDLNDPKAKDDAQKDGAVTFTRAGGGTFKEADVIRKAVTPVPQFFAARERPDRTGEVARAGEEVEREIAAVRDQYATAVDRWRVPPQGTSSADARRAIAETAAVGGAIASAQLDGWRGRVAALGGVATIDDTTARAIDAKLANDVSAGRATIEQHARDATHALGGVGVPAKPKLPSLGRLALRLGPSFGAYQSANQLSIGLEGAFAVTPDHRGSVTFMPQVDVVGNQTRLMLPLGFEYAFPVGNFGLSIFARLAIGYLAQFIPLPSGTFVNHAGVVIPEAGVRWSFKQHYHVALEPFSLPIFFDSSFVGVDYRIMASGGIDLPWGGNTVEVTQDKGDGDGDNNGKQPPANACPTLELHRPISQDDDEPAVDDLDHGAYTLRNDDADYEVGASAPPANPHFITDALPLTDLQTDVEQTANGDENDLVHVKVSNPGLPNVFLFAFELESEDDRKLGTKVAKKAGAQVNKTFVQLKNWQDAQKTNAAPDFPIPVPKGNLDIWVEGLLGGRYRIVVGQLAQPNTEKNESYEVDTHKTKPPLACETQAQLTVVVVDVYQKQDVTRSTAFDVYWSGKPYFEAEAWPPSGNYTWAVNYKRGKRVLTVPATAVTGNVGFMLRDAAENEPKAPNPEIKPGRPVTARGAAGAGNKAKFDGGLEMESPTTDPAAPAVFPSPRVTATRAHRYPDRVSVQYEVENETLVRIEPLEIILPRVEIPAASFEPGSETGAESRVHYVINDHLQLATPRRITAKTVQAYVELYGAGLKAWEALSPGTGAAVTAEATADKLTDGIRLDIYSVTLPAIPPATAGERFKVGTAQRSQASVKADRMTDGTFEDSLRFTFEHSANDLASLLDQITGNQRQVLNTQSGTRTTAYRKNAADPAETASDGNRVRRFPVSDIPQDVILQLRVGGTRRDLRVLTENHLKLIAPYFYGTMMRKPNPNDPNPLKPFDDTFVFHMEYAPGNDTAPVLVPQNYRRPGGVDAANNPIPPPR